MRSYFKISIPGLLLLFHISCNKDNLDFTDLNSIPMKRYYSSDNMPEKYKDLYGTWEVTGTSGGESGVGYGKDFDYMIVKKNCIFGIIRND